MSPQDIERTIGRASVYDQMLDARIALVTDALDRFFDVADFIDTWRDDSDERLRAVLAIEHLTQSLLQFETTP